MQRRSGIRCTMGFFPFPRPPNSISRLWLHIIFLCYISFSVIHIIVYILIFFYFYIGLFFA